MYALAAWSALHAQAVLVDPGTTCTRTHRCVVRVGVSTLLIGQVLCVIPNCKHAYWVGYPDGSIGEDIVEGCLVLCWAIFVGQDSDNLKYVTR